MKKVVFSFIAVGAVGNHKNNRHKSFIWIVSAVAFTLSVLLALIAPPYIRARVIGFLNPEQYAATWGYQISVAKETIEKAGWLGQGSINEQVTMLPEAHTDFILPYIIYVFGWAGGLLLLAIFSLFVIRMVQAAIKVNHPFGKLIVVGGLTIFLITLITNILVVFGWLPTISIPLPFISYGGAQLIFFSAIIGLLLSVYRRERWYN